MATGEAGIPDTLTGIPITPPGRYPRGRQNRRARSNVPGRAAEILPPVKRGQKVWRLRPNNAALHEYARKRELPLGPRGGITNAIREAYRKENAWEVRIIRLRPPGATEASEFFEVMQGSYVRRITTDPFYVARTMGDELYAQLKEVKT